jgi:VanZ family protein
MTHAADRSPLPLYLAAAYTLLAVYGSLYPWSGWHDSGAPISAFLFAAWPRYYTSFDLTANVVAYVPFGFLGVTAMLPRLGAPGAVFVATVFGFALSLAMESLQHYLPSRVPSNVDLACNAAGAMLGALGGARWGAMLLDGGRLHALRQKLLMRGRAGDWGLVLLGLWLVSQLNPVILLFGNGDLHTMLELPTPLHYSADRFAKIEGIAVCAHTLAIALIAGRITPSAPHRAAFAMIMLGLIIKTAALLLLMQGAQGLAWATPGSLSGLFAGVVLWLIVARTPAFLRQALAALVLLFATVLVNLTPDNPYLINTQHFWTAGAFLNFNGLTRLTSSLWPFLALPWLFLLRPQHE